MATNSSLQYTDEQIKLAVLDMPMNHRAEFVHDWELNMFRQFLEALPDQPGDWQECTFDEIRKGDRVRIVTENFYTVYDHPVLEVGQTSICSTILFACGTRAFLDDYNTLYRIPAPVTHPDPEVCEHIIVYETTRQKYGPQNREYPSFHYSWDDDLWRGDISRVLQSWEILEWDYAKVVIADE